MREGCVKSFVKLIVLQALGNNPLYGYGIMEHIYRTTKVLLSPGTIYPMLQSMEKEKVIEKVSDQKKALYKLTQDGRELLETMSSEYCKMFEWLFPAQYLVHVSAADKQEIKLESAFDIFPESLMPAARPDNIKMTSRLNEDRPPEQCEQCREEWARYVTKYDPEIVFDEYEILYGKSKTDKPPQANKNLDAHPVT